MIGSFKVLLRSLALAVLLACAFGCSSPQGIEWIQPGSVTGKADFPGAIPRVKFGNGGSYLLAEILRDDIVHFEVSNQSPGQTIYTTPMVAKHDYPGPKKLEQLPDGFATLDLRVKVDLNSLCVTITDLKKTTDLSTVCPHNLEQTWKGLGIDKKAMSHVYGLGNYFYDSNSTDGDWMGRVWQDEYSGYGNFRRSFDGAAPSTSQFPILYALGPGKTNYAMFLDHPYKMRWDFTGSWWSMDTWGDQIRWFFFAGDDLQDLYQDYLDLVGHPLVPPKRMFGFWQSRFGYENWGEIDSELSSLRQSGFPIDGFSLDIQWFGREFGADPSISTMGSLRFDTNRFPNPEIKVADLLNQEGVALMTIEESLVASNLQSWKDMRERGFLVRAGCETCDASYLNSNTWWGEGGYIDWTNPEAGDFWHDSRRQSLVDMGITAHWTDLGEPEASLFDPNGYYYGFPEINKHRHPDVHNLYSFRWLESIARGYTRNHILARPFMMTRGGAPGIQRFGAGMWSGDIARNLGSLKAHLNTQMHLALAGIDFYGSDAGGFTKPDFGLDAGDPSELYTQWFAISAMIDTPLRPHGWAVGADKQSFAPNQKGHLESNRANLWQRYQLSPYVYSLAHRAHLDAEPVFPPLVYYYQEDLNLRRNADVKLFGRDLLFGIVAGYGQTERRVYLPRGRWINFHSNEWFDSSGGETLEIPVYREGLLRLPLFARASAIIPLMKVDGETMNVSGKRSDGSKDVDLWVRVFASDQANDFTLFEDDGETTGYLQGDLRATKISQQLTNDEAVVIISPADGTYPGAPDERNNYVELVVDNAKAASVSLNGTSLSEVWSIEDLEGMSQGGYYNAGNNLIIANSGLSRVSDEKEFGFQLVPVAAETSIHFVCGNGVTNNNQSVYALGNIPQLGNWDPDRAFLLIPTRYPRWSRVLEDVAPNTHIEWMCIVRSNNGGPVVTWDASKSNHVVDTPSSGFSGTTAGFF